MRHSRSRPRARTRKRARVATPPVPTPVERLQPADDATPVDIVAGAAAVIEDAAAIMDDAAAAVHDVAADRDSNQSQEDAARFVESAAAVMQEAAAVVQETAAVMHEAVVAGTWTGIDRRRMPRLAAFRRHEAHVQWKHILWYVPVVVAAVIIGALAIWSFIERQSLVVQPTPLPKVTLITADPRSRLTASWVRLLTASEMQPTLVPVDQLEVLQGVVVICDLPSIPPKLSEALTRFIGSGGSVAILGAPPSNPIGNVSLVADSGTSDGGIRIGSSASPVLARLNPGYVISARRTTVPFLKESARMTVDARWSANARAVVMHMERNGSRYLWMGFDPDAVNVQDGQLSLMLHTAFRWVAGQPVSDGAIGDADLARSFSPEARRLARDERFAFGVEPLRGKQMFRIRMTNRGGRPIENPTVKVWLPPRATHVTLAGDIIMKRGASLIALPDEGACLISLPSLTRNEERLMKIEVEY